MNEKILERMLECYDSSSQQDKDELNHLLENHAPERQAFIIHNMDEEIIREEFRLEHVEKIFADDDLNSESVEPTHRASNIVKFYPILAVAAAIAILFTVGIGYQKFIQKDNNDDSIVAKPIADTAPAWCAKLMDYSSDTQWSGELKRTAILNPGMYELTKGTTLIEFSNGVQLTVESPAKLEIKNSLEVILHQGKVRANVPEAGHGFVVNTPDIKIRDLGTEFGVEVGESDRTQVHVFHGEIELYENQKTIPVKAYEGFAAKWVSGKRTKQMVANEAIFATGQDIALEQWKHHQASLKKDPSLLVHYDFRGSGDIIKNTMSDQYSGVIHSPIRIRGRWLDQSALLFDSPDNWAEVDLPTVEGDFSLQTWVSVDRLAFSINAIMNTKKWNPDSLHLQLSRRGNLHLGVKGKNIYDIYSKEMIPIGKWIQLTATYDSERQQMSLYINDKKVSEKQRDIKRVVFGKTLLGCWIQGGKRVRGFRGRMDELSLRSRCLSPDEISASYQLGQPAP